MTVFIPYSGKKLNSNKKIAAALQLTLPEVPCFAQMKIVHNTVSKMTFIRVFFNT